MASPRPEDPAFRLIHVPSVTMFLSHRDFFQTFQAELLALTWPRGPGMLERHHNYFFATVPKNMESFLMNELISLGALKVNETRAGASFEGSMELAYRVCLWSRIANRVLLPIRQFPAETPEALYEGIRDIPWDDHLENSGTLAVEFNTSRSAITHTKYGALKVKDGIVDFFRDKTGTRPSVDLGTPDVRVNVFVLNNEAKVSLDLSGESLHRRGYRTEGASAPLKENLAAAVLIKAGWPTVAEAGGTIIDPMCGSGTLLIEAALIAADSAPGLLRPYYGFLKWKQHQPEVWERLIDEAEEREREGFGKMPPIIGYDHDASAVQSALRNVTRAGMTGMIHVERRELTRCVPSKKTSSKPGMLIVNPPYGKRIGEVRELKRLYSALGRQLRTHFQGWKAGVLTGNPDSGVAMGIRAKEKQTFFNGPIRCDFLEFDIIPKWYVEQEHALFGPASFHRITPQIIPLAEPFANRVKKNRRKLKSWLKKESITAYRIYDQDLPDFAVAVDIYNEHVHVQEYQAPKTVDPQKAEKRLRAVLDALPMVLNIPPNQVFLKVRQKQKGAFQYKKQASRKEFQQVSEYGCRFLVNLTDYLDTGLFLDHRLIRGKIRDLARGKRFLNLFSYTGAASVYAAKGGAKSTTSVDISKVYSDWAKSNMALNGFSAKKHQFIAADCLEWVKSEKNAYDLILLDPPTFSNSKKMRRTFDVQRDHVPLIHQVTRLLAPDGLLIFSTNYRRFKLDQEALSHLHVEDWTARTIPPDFRRRANIHHCWKITL
jgi:23S rRNA (guanine2445-N2)-methyltransferase / 23S rRNA (guanine2069-N7)-methyltransferase